MEIIVYALDLEVKALKKHFSTNVRFEKCGVYAKNLDFLKNLSSNDHVTNIGVCAGENIGQIYLCNKIIGDKTYYPDILIKNSLEQKQIKTVNYVVAPDEVANNPDTLFDQEAAIIYKESQKYISPHQISFLKIVSDAGINDFNEVRKNIPILIENKIPKIKNFITNANKLVADSPDIDITKYIDILKPSVTMQNRLKQQIRYSNILNVNVEEFFEKLPKISNKADSLEALDCFDKFLLDKSI